MEKIKDLLSLVLMVVFFMGIIWTAIGWNIYAFKDCKKVGHSTLYCIGRIGK